MKKYAEQGQAGTEAHFREFKKEMSDEFKEIMQMWTNGMILSTDQMPKTCFGILNLHTLSMQIHPPPTPWRNTIPSLKCTGEIGLIVIPHLIGHFNNHEFFVFK